MTACLLGGVIEILDLTIFGKAKSAHAQTVSTCCGISDVLLTHWCSIKLTRSVLTISMVCLHCYINPFGVGDFKSNLQHDFCMLFCRNTGYTRYVKVYNAVESEMSS